MRLTMPALEELRTKNGEPARGIPGSGDVADAIDGGVSVELVETELIELAALSVSAIDEDAPGFDCETAWPRCYGGYESW